MDEDLHDAVATEVPLLTAALPLPDPLSPHSVAQTVAPQTSTHCPDISRITDQTHSQQTTALPAHATAIPPHPQHAPQAPDTDMSTACRQPNVHCTDLVTDDTLSPHAAPELTDGKRRRVE